jgi:hypothetical protein
MVITFKNTVEFFTFFMLSLGALLFSLCSLNLAQYIMPILLGAKGELSQHKYWVKECEPLFLVQIQLGFWKPMFICINQTIHICFVYCHENHLVDYLPIVL